MFSKTYFYLHDKSYVLNNFLHHFVRGFDRIFSRDVRVVIKKRTQVNPDAPWNIISHKLQTYKSRSVMSYQVLIFCRWSLWMKRYCSRNLWRNTWLYSPTYLALYKPLKFRFFKRMNTILNIHIMICLPPKNLQQPSRIVHFGVMLTDLYLEKWKLW